MVAPAAPVIRGRTNGIAVRVLWQPVPNATDYKLYVGPAANPTTLEDDIHFTEVGADGWFQSTFVPDDIDGYIAVTALNITAEESAHSNELRIRTGGAVGTSFGKADPNKRPRNTSDPFGAL